MAQSLVTGGEQWLVMVPLSPLLLLPVVAVMVTVCDSEGVTDWDSDD